MSSGRGSWWALRKFFSLGNNANADASSFSGTSSYSYTTASFAAPDPEVAQEGEAGPLAKKPRKEKEGAAEPSQPPPNRLSGPKSAPAKSSKLKKVQEQDGGGDGEPKKKSTTQHGKKRKRGVAWSKADELKILEAMAKHAESHGGALPETSHLLHTVGNNLDKTDANVPKLADKLRKLKTRYDSARLQGWPTDEDDDDDDDDDDARQIFQLCEKVWGSSSTELRRSTRNKQVLEVAHQGGVGGGGGEGRDGGDEDQSQEAAHKDRTTRVKKGGVVRRELTELSVMYPSLYEEIEKQADENGEVIKEAFMFIGDDDARHFDGIYKKIKKERLNMKVVHTDVSNSLMSTLMDLMK